MDPKEMVRAGYDAVSHAYRRDEADDACAQYDAWIVELTAALPPRASILDLGCGNGIPVARRLSKTFEVTGVDISPVQIQRAKDLVPGGRFLCADITSLRLPPGSVDAVVSFYAIIHVPLDQQPSLFASIRRWLRPGGLFMATLGAQHWTGTERDWLGVQGAEMYWSHADAATYARWLQDNAFEIVWTRFIAEGTGGHTLVLATAV